MKTKILTILCFLTSTLLINLPAKATSHNERCQEIEKISSKKNSACKMTRASYEANWTEFDAECIKPDGEKEIIKNCKVKYDPDVNHNKDDSSSLNKLCYTNLSEGFNEFSNNLSQVNIQQYKGKIKKLGINKYGKKIDYAKAIPMADIVTTNDELGRAIKQINQSLIKLNDVKKACSNELDEYISRD